MSKTQNIKSKPKVNKFVKGATVALIASGLTFATVYSVANVKTNDYSSQEQIQTISDALNSDISVMKFLAHENDHVKRLKHNDGEPIYIKIQDDYPEQFEDMAKESIDYVFNIVGGVNDLYKNYKFVDESQSVALEKQGKTVIEYNLGNNLESFVGGLTSANNVGEWYNQLTNKQVIQNPEIVMNFERLQEYDENTAKTSYVHELLHVFGFGDVYNDKSNFETNTYYGNTIMKAGRNISLIAPNDYACIMSAYAKPMNNNQLADYISKCKNQLSSYEDYYYGQLVEFSEKQNSFYLKNKVDFDDVENHSDFTIQTTDLDGTVIIEKYNITCKNGNYKIVITDENDKVIDSITGKAKLINGVYVLENAEFEKNIRPLSEAFAYDGYKTDLVLHRTAERDYLYDTSNNFIYWGDENINQKNNDLNSLNQK